MQRRIDPRQQGSRISWFDTLFELVEAVPPPPFQWIEVPDDVREVSMEEFIAAQAAAGSPS